MEKRRLYHRLDRALDSAYEFPWHQYPHRPGLQRPRGIAPATTAIGPKRYVAPALKIRELPRIDLILLSHAHMDHFDLPSLKRLSGEATVVTAKSTSDLLDGMRFKKIIELDWNALRRKSNPHTAPAL